MTDALNTQLAATFKAACLAELEALKPGNVHIFADGHGMNVEQFMASAEAAAQRHRRVRPAARHARRG